ncbi:MAG: TonB-dependent receptor domain-containing protein [Bryobacteraceae bacterium]
MRNRLFPFFGALFITSALSWAQNTGRLSGKVEDPANAPVPNAEIQVSLPGSEKAVFSTATSSEGFFHLIGIPAGEYDLTIGAGGFRNYHARALKVDPGRELTLPVIRLELGSVVEAIEVSAQSAPVQTSNAEIATTVSSQQVLNLPTLNRQMITLIQTQAGVSDGRGPTSINGLRTSGTNVTIDGINVQDNYFRRSSLDFIPNRPTTDQVAEFTITTSNANASVGGGAVQVVMVTPSGSNQYHGTALWANRNNYFAANDWFANRDRLPSPFLNQNQYGGYIGGPVIKNRLLFYAGYEKLDARQQKTVTRRILTQTARDGLFTYRSGTEVRQVNVLQVAGVTADPTIQGLLAKVPGADRINNFNTGDSVAGLLRNTGGFSFLTRNNGARDNITAKVDYLLSPRHLISGTYLWNNEFVDREDVMNDSVANNWTNGFGAVPTAFTDASRNLLSLTWRFNPTARFTNEARFGFNLAPSKFGSTENYPVNYRLTYISNPQSNALPQGRDTYTFHYMDNASYVSGKHNFQFGFNVHQLRIRKFENIGIRPLLYIGLGQNRGLTGADLPGAGPQDIQAANDLLSLMGGYVERIDQIFNVSSRDSGFVPNTPNERRLRLLTYALYLQDTWKIRPRLTLTLGMRWEPFMPVDEANSLFLLPRMTDGNPIHALLSNSTLDFAGRSAGRPWYQRDLNNFAPNIGLAWDPFGDGKASVRAGYMIAYVNDNTVRALENNVATNDGLRTNVIRTGLAANLRNPPTVQTPRLQVPRTFADNYALDRTAAFGLPDPGLATPYIQQWNLSIQREFQGNVLEVRYLGNRSVKLYRGIDYNQIDIRSNGIFDDFLRAYNNGNLARAATGTFNPNYNAAIAGSQPLTVIPTLPGSGGLNTAADRGRIERGEIGAYLNALQNDGRNGALNFYRNPVALGTNMMTNYSTAGYHALQVDLQRRLRAGLQLQVNYTYGKVLSDAGAETDDLFDAFLDINNPRIERARAPFDITHAFKANGIWKIPGGHRFHSPVLRRVFDGWMLGGILTTQSGVPFSVFSRRATLNRNGRSNNNTANTILDKSQLDQIFQIQYTSTGPFFVAASARNPGDGRAISADGRAFFNGQAFFHPGPGALGSLQRRMFSGPWLKNLDLSVIKQIQIREGHRVTFRGEAFNLTNTPSWNVDDQLVDSPQFGRITATLLDRRILQFGLQYRF